MIISIFSGLMFAVNSSLYIVWLRRTRPFRDLEAELWMATSKKSYIQCWIVAVNWCCQQLCFGTCYTPAFRRQLYCEDSAPRTLTSLDKHPAQTCDSFCRWSGSKSFEALCSAVSFAQDRRSQFIRCILTSLANSRITSCPSASNPHFGKQWWYVLV